MSPLAPVVVLIGVALCIAGVALLSVPAALILAGAAIGAFGLLGIRVDE